MTDASHLATLLEHLNACGQLDHAARERLAASLRAVPLAAGQCVAAPKDGGLLLLLQGELASPEGAILELGTVIDQGWAQQELRTPAGALLGALSGAQLQALLGHGQPAALALLRQQALQRCVRLRALQRPPLVLEGTLPVSCGVPAPCAPGGQALPGAVSPDLASRVATTAPFRDLAPGALRPLLAAMRQRRAGRGDILLREGVPVSSALLLVSGSVELYQRRDQGRQRLAVLGPGRWLAQPSLLDRGPAGATCTVRQEAQLLELGADAFVGLLAAGDAAARALLQALSADLLAALRRTAHGEPALVETLPRSTTPSHQDRQQLVERIRASVVGNDLVLDGPFGPLRMVYADYTASGRSLGFLEEFIRDEVMPCYANTHTESSGTGLQTSRLREDARRIVLRGVGGDEDDVIIFCGSGATAAIDKLMGVLGLKLSPDLDQRFALLDSIPAEQRPVVFVGPYEHHSNDVPWRFSIADLVMIDEDADGRIDLAQLERELLAHQDRPLKIGSFSAASNVSGIVSDTVAITELLHEYGALSFWDYAAAAPYVEIAMNPPGRPQARKDAVFLSPHKFIGGPGTPGVLAAKRALFENAVPTVPGGGTVAYVSSSDQDFLDDPVHREEGGTPAILESIRAGLVFQLKEAVGIDLIQRLEHDFVRRAIARWQQNPKIWILGNPELERLSIVSLVIRHGERYLHWNFAVALLNDLFGVQARGGCSCAGPYGHRLFRIGPELSRDYQRVIASGYEGIKPGWVRINFNYFISEEVFQYLLEAIDLVASEGWKLLPRYRFDPHSAMWTHRDGPPEPMLRLEQLSYVGGALEYQAPRSEQPDQVLKAQLERARALLAEAGQGLDEARDPCVPEDFDQLRWFPFGGEVG